MSRLLLVTLLVVQTGCIFVSGRRRAEPAQRTTGGKVVHEHCHTKPNGHQVCHNHPHYDPGHHD